MASLNVVAPTGKIMNSWQASRFPAWLPPLITLKEGTGITNLSVGFPASLAMYWYNGIFFEAAPARQTAIDTARMALAPSFDLDQPHSFCVPSRTSTICLSTPAWSVQSLPTSAGPMTSFTFFTAVMQPFPL